MEVLKTPRFLLSGVSTGVGKFVLGVGIAHELRRKGISVSCCVLGANLLQAVIFRRMTGRYTPCLDPQLISWGTGARTLFQSGVGADLVMVLGSGGLFDSLSASSLAGSDADFARVTHTPVVLTVDGSEIGTSLTALVRGFREEADDVSVPGVVLTRFSELELGGVAKRDLFGDALQQNDLGTLLGVVPPTTYRGDLPPRTIVEGRNRTVLPRQFFVEIADLVREHVDLDSLIALATEASHVELPDLVHEPQGRRVRIAVAEDSCFHICFQDNLNLLKYYGAEIVTFSPLADEHLPKNIGAVYITGGSLDDYAHELSRNSSMHNALRDFVACGGVLYSEGAGTAYLCERFELSNEVEPLTGVGILKGEAFQEPGQVSYREGQIVEDTVIGPPDLFVKGLATNGWRFEEYESTVTTMRILRDFSDPLPEGYSPTAQSFLTFGFSHFGSQPEVARHFVESAHVIAPLS